MTDIHEYIQNAMPTYYTIQFFMAHMSYFLIYVYLNILPQSQILRNSL